MNHSDPYFSVKEEVKKSLNQARVLFEKWSSTADSTTAHSRNVREDSCAQLKVCLRNIDLDLEDLDESIAAVKENPERFHISEPELSERRHFIEDTKHTVKKIREDLSKPLISNGGLKSTSHPGSAKRAPVERNDPASSMFGFGGGRSRYTLLENSDSGHDNTTALDLDSSPTHRTDDDEFIGGEMRNQKMVIRTQDDTLDKMGSSVNVLKGMSRQIGSELDDQSVMLDEFAHEMETTDSKLDSNMKKIAKVLHMSNDRRQWMAIGILALALIIVIILLVVL